jgi:hypothetical protein
LARSGRSLNKRPNLREKVCIEIKEEITVTRTASQIDTAEIRTVQTVNGMMGDTIVQSASGMKEGKVALIANMKIVANRVAAMHVIITTVTTSIVTVTIRDAIERTREDIEATERMVIEGLMPTGTKGRSGN